MRPALGSLQGQGGEARGVTTVLVVDDDASVRALVCAWLGRADVHCLEAVDGPSALHLATSCAATIDCIVLDVMMPGFDGFELLERLAATPDTAHIPAILLTARAGTDEEVVAALDVGAVDYLEKPFSGRILVAKVLAAAQRTKRERSLRGALAYAETHAAIDPLTGIFNRQHLDQRLREEAAVATRHHMPFSIVLIDLDHFKSINDTFGHPEGDRVLVHVADVMKSALREEDCAFRYGGEEFVLMLRNCNVTAATVVAWRLRQALRDRRIRLGNEVPRIITFSAGIASANEANGFASESLLRRADSALYRAKRGGRDRAEVEHVANVGQGVASDFSVHEEQEEPAASPVSSAIRPTVHLADEEDKRVS